MRNIASSSTPPYGQAPYAQASYPEIHAPLRSVAALTSAGLVLPETSQSAAHCVPQIVCRDVVMQGCAFFGLGSLICLLLCSACSGVPGDDGSNAIITGAHHASRSTAASHPSARAQLASALAAPTQPDGVYAAQVSTWTETYHGPVKVSAGRVISIYWPKWGHVTVTGGKLNGDFAEAVTSHGEMVRIELEEQVHNG